MVHGVITFYYSFGCVLPASSLVDGLVGIMLVKVKTIVIGLVQIFKVLDSLVRPITIYAFVEVTVAIIGLGEIARREFIVVFPGAIEVHRARLFFFAEGLVPIDWRTIATIWLEKIRKIFYVVFGLLRLVCLHEIINIILISFLKSPGYGGEILRWHWVVHFALEQLHGDLLNHWLLAVWHIRHRISYGILRCILGTFLFLLGECAHHFFIGFAMVVRGG